MSTLDHPVSALGHRLPQGETVRGHRGHRPTQSQGLRAQATRAWTEIHIGIRVALPVGVLAILIGFLVLALSPDDWQRAFIGGGIAAVGILALAVTASVWAGERP